MTTKQIVESFLNPRIRLDPRIWEVLPEHFGPVSPADQSTTVESLKLRNLAKIAPLLRTFDNNLPEVYVIYKTVRDDCQTMSQSLSTLTDSPTETSFNITRFLQVRFQSAFGTLLHVAMILNAALRAEGITNASLRTDLAFFIDEANVLGKESSKYRPLGSCSIPLCLIAAWAVTDDDQIRESLEQMLSDWQMDFGSARWMDMAIWWKTKMTEPKWIQNLQPWLSSFSKSSSNFPVKSFTNSSGLQVSWFHSLLKIT